ncbi:hypothetical protein [Streptomyces niveus]|uniref:hypothetical protein n=1 Tax=Streptomyces niveus TaxID=193462 RepID=UPI0036484764
MPEVTKIEEFVPRHRYTLTLTEEEATAVAVVLARIGGDQTTGVRALTQPVLEALEAVGTDFYGSEQRMHLSGHLTSE